MTKEEKEINEWIINQHSDGKSAGTIGGRFKYEFTPTGVGTIGTVVDTLTNESFTFRELK